MDGRGEKKKEKEDAIITLNIKGTIGAKTSAM